MKEKFRVEIEANNQSSTLKGTIFNIIKDVIGMILIINAFTNNTGVATALLTVIGYVILKVNIAYIR